MQFTGQFTGLYTGGAKLAAWLGGKRATADELERVLSAITGEPDARIATFVAAAQRRLDAFQHDYDWLAANEWAKVKQRIEAVGLPQAHELGIALSGIRRPLLLACTHSGNYLSGLLRLLSALPSLRALTVLKRPAPSEREARLHRHLGNLGVELDVLRLADRPLLPALHALREGHHVLLMFDVPPSFGSSSLAPAQLFGHQARLPEGPAALAVGAGALILPITCGCAANGDEVRVGALIDAARRRDESRRAATARIHAQLARQLDGWLRVWPEDWMLWPHLPSYFAQPESANAKRGRSTPREKSLPRP